MEVFVLGLIPLLISGVCEGKLLLSDAVALSRANLGDFRGERHEFEVLYQNITRFVSHLYLSNTDSECSRHLEAVLKEADYLNVEALKIIDATAKLPPGILSGNLNQYGDFDECVSSEIYTGNGKIKGKYCLAIFSVIFRNPYNSSRVSVIDDLIHSHRSFRNEINVAGHRMPKMETFNWGICVPNSCTSNHITKSVKAHFQSFTHFHIDVDVNEKMCFEQGTRSFSALSAMVLLYFTFVILLSIYATATDRTGRQAKPGKLTQYVECFSLKRNLSELVKTEFSKDEIGVLHGARFLNAIALLFSHKKMAIMFNPFVNRSQMALSLSQPWSMLGRSAILYTDTFILMSGLLQSYSVVKELDQKRRINFKDRFISRLVRFTPNLLALVLFCTFLIEHLGSGPLWGLVIKQYADLCKANMWKNFLYVHNYFGFENMCLTHTHQLGIDMQLFLASPILIYLLWKNTRIGLVLLSLLAAASTYLRYSVTLKENLSTLIYFGISVERLWKTANLSYILPTHRLTVYIAGILLGYLLRRDCRRITLNRLTALIGWIIALASGLLAMFGPYHVSAKDYVYDSMDAAVYNAFSPILWIIFLSWILFACESDWAGQLRGFLSWKYFAIFSRISYAVYLTQFPVFFYGVGIQRSTSYYRGLHSMIDLPELLLILALSVGMTLLFDLPFQNLRKIFKQSSGAAEYKKNDDVAKVFSYSSDLKQRRVIDRGD